jgi:hypothetical protein
MTYHPEYDPEMISLFYGGAQEGVGSFVGPRAIGAGRRQTIRTIVHEELHHRLWRRGWWYGLKAGKWEDYIETVIDRFMRIKGL